MLRVVPPAPWQVAAGPGAPCIAFIGTGTGTVVLATAACGLGVEVTAGIARVVASRERLAALAAELARRRSPVGGLLRRCLEPEPAWRLRTRELRLDRPHVMGIVNLTKDSFSGDGVGRRIERALRRAEELRAAGASLVDVGAETARADRPALSPAEEAPLVAGAVEALVREGHCVSADTYKPEVARAALGAGAEAVNDISGLTLGTATAVEAARAGAGYVLTYSYTVPKRRPERRPEYADVVAETLAWLLERIERLRRLGLADGQLAIDPGIAFGKSHDEDLQVLRRIGELRTPGLPLLLAHSRKNYIGSVAGLPPAERDLETHVSTVLAYAQGVRIFRVHDVAGTVRALAMARAVLDASPGDFAPGAESWPWRAGAASGHMTRGEADKAPPPGQRW